MSESSGQRYCGNCGAEIRSGISFCVSCGKPVHGGPASPGPDNSVPPPTPSKSLADTLKETFQGLTQRFSNARSASGGTSLSGLPNKAINWFKDLPSVPKLIIVGLLLLLLLTVISPVARVVAIIAFVVSAIVLAIRVNQRKPLRGWIIAVVGSVVLIPIFGGISGAIYGSDSSGRRDSASGEVGESESSYSAPDSQDPEGGDAEYAYSEATDGTLVRDLDIPEMYPGDSPIHHLHGKGSIVVFTSNEGYQLEENCRMIVLPNGNPLFYSKAAPDKHWCVHLVGFSSGVYSGSSIPDPPCATAPDGTWYCTDPSKYVTIDDLKLADDAGYLP